MVSRQTVGYDTVEHVCSNEELLNVVSWDWVVVRNKFNILPTELLNNLSTKKRYQDDAKKEGIRLEQWTPHLKVPVPGEILSW